MLRSPRRLLSFFGRLALPTKLVLIGSASTVGLAHVFEVDFFEPLAAFFERHEVWELDEIFLLIVFWVPALLLDYCVAVLQRLRKANQRLVLANAELVRADQAKDQLLAARQQAETQLHQTNQKLTRITRLKDEFLASMSHEFRTPLNAILSITEGLQGGIYGTIDSAQVGALQTIERSGFHLLELINDILDVAQIYTGP
ncbi:MAG: histidine kinase dimerization/phospho-acceptor domain-containing protein [Cyanobacteria bacterium J06626_18]